MSDSKESYKSFSNIILPPIINIFYYPLYRTYTQIKVSQISREFKPEMIAEAKSLILKNGRFRGFSSYLVSSYILAIGTIWNDCPLSITLTFIFTTFVIQYPFLINSNLRALDLPGYASLKNVSEVTRLIFNKSNYKGIGYHFLSKLCVIIPFLNLLSYRYESTRLAYVLGTHYGHDFKNYKEARQFLATHEYLKPGKLYYNLPFHAINGSICFLMIYALIYGKKSI